MHHLAVVPIAAIMRAVIRSGRKPMRVGQVASLVVHFELVATMYADLGLRLGLGRDSHAGQNTRRGLESVLV